MRKGFSLIEIVIGVILIGFLILPIVLFFNQTIKNFTYGKPNQKVVEVVTDAINEISTLLRQSSSIEIAEIDKIGFIIPKDGGERKIIFEFDNGFIKRTDDFGTKYTPYHNTPNTPISEAVIFELSFKYFDENGNEVSNPDLVRMIAIGIKGTPRQIPQGLENPEFSLESTVKLRNVK